MKVANPANDELHEPPTPTRKVVIVGLIGVGLCLIAWIMGLVTSAPLRGFDTHRADGARAFLSVLGLVVAGCSVAAGALA